MPELPEAVTISSQLAPFLTNSKLKEIIIKKDSIIKGREKLKDIVGLNCLEVGNYGKMVYLRFPNYWVVFHLALTGYIVINPSEIFYHHSVLEFHFDSNIVVFGAKRMFEKVIVYDNYPFDKYGPDFRKIDSFQFVKLVSKYNKPIKVVLMDQNVIAGIGNIYSCEALFASGILPIRNARNITVQEYYKLYDCLVKIIDLAIEKRGSTISDYVDAFGNKGQFQNYHKIYGKKKCLVCSSKVKVVRIQSRITYYCPTCQK